MNLEKVTERYLNLTDQIAALEAEKDSLAALIRTECDPGTATDAGQYSVVVSKPAKRLNTKKLTALFPVAMHPHLYKATIDLDAVKYHFSHWDLEDQGAYTETAPRITIKQSEGAA